MGSTATSINISLILPVKKNYNPRTADNKYFSGRLWINIDTKEIFFCSDCTPGVSATWLLIGRQKTEKEVYGMMYGNINTNGEYNFRLQDNFKPEMKAMYLDNNQKMVEGITGVDYSDLIANVGSSAFWLYDEIDPDIPQVANVAIYPFFLARVRGRLNGDGKRGYARGSIRTLKHCFENLSIYARPDTAALRSLMYNILNVAGVASQVPDQVSFDTNILDYSEIFWLSHQSKGERLCNFPKIRKSGDPGSHALLIPYDRDRVCFDTSTGAVISVGTGHSDDVHYEYAGFYGYADNQLGNLAITDGTSYTTYRKEIIGRLFSQQAGAIRNYGYIGIFLFRDKDFPQRYIIQLKPLTCDTITVDFALDNSGGRVNYDLEAVTIDPQGRLLPVKSPLSGSRFNLGLFEALIDSSSKHSIERGHHHFPRVFFRYRDKITGKVGKLSQTGVTIKLWEKGGRVPYRLRTIQQAL